MVKVIAGFLIGLICVSPVAQAGSGSFRTVFLKENESHTIRLKYGRLTVLSFEEPIRERWNPVPKAIVDHISKLREDLLLLPTVEGGESNLVVIAGDTRYHFTIRVTPSQGPHDEIVRVKRRYDEWTPKKRKVSK